MRKLLIALALVVGQCAPAYAQTICLPRAEFAETAARRFQETVVALGLTSTGRLLEVYASTNGETWTLVITTPEGMSCLAISGEAWRSATRGPTGEVS